MWGSWYTTLFGGLLVILLLIGVAFGTSALLFPLVIAAAIMAVVAVLYALGSVGRRTEAAAGPARDPVRDAAPASGEGSDPAT
jgi:hypothetical protein